MSKSKYNIPGDGNCLFNSVLITYVDANGGNYHKTSEGGVITDQSGLRKLVSLYYKEHFEEVKDLLKNMLIDTIKLKNFAGFGKLYQQLNEIYSTYRKKHSANKEAYLEEAVNEELIEAYIQGIEDGSIWGGGSELDILSKLLLIKIKLAGQEHSFNSSGNDDVSEIEIQYTGGNHFNALILNPKNAIVTGIIKNIKAEPNVKEHSNISKSQSNLLKKLSEKEFLLVMQIIFNKREAEQIDYDNPINDQEIVEALDYLKKLKIYSTKTLKTLTVDQLIVEDGSEAKKKEESNVDEELRIKLSSLSLEDQENVVNDPHYFPRCEYRIRFEDTSAFAMEDKEYWGTYFRSTSRGGNADRLSKLKDKAYRNSHINIEGTAAKTGAFRSPFDNKEYAGILHTNTPKGITLALSREPERQYLYDEILVYKGKICQDAIRNFDLQTRDSKSKLIGLVPYYKNDYPCIIVSITTPKLKNIKNKTEKGGLYKLITAYYVAITNQIAWEENIPVELVLRSSFGHNIPSVSDTGDSFRINVGLVPSIYTMVLVKGLVSLWDKFLSPLLESDHSFTLGIEAKKLKYINAEIASYNDKKNNDYTERQKQKKAIKPKKVENWKSKDSLFDVLSKVGDSSGRKVVHQLVRQDWYIDLLANLISKELDQEKPDMAAPIRILLNRISYETVVTLKIEDTDLEGGFFTFIKNNEWVENTLIKEEKEFWKILGDIRLALASNKKLDERLSSVIKAKVLIGLYQKLEETNLEFIRNSGYQEIEDEVGSDSDCEGELTDKVASTVFSRKIIVVTGMRAINLATYVALYQITKYTEASSYKLLSDSMYYETEEAVDSVLNAFSGFFEIPTSKKSKDTEVAEVLFFDLTHCDSTNQDSGQSLEEMMDKKQYPVIILDYTSATTANIRTSVEVCFRHTSLILLVNSGLKNEQAGADMNPYGTLRIVTLDNKDLMIELYNLAYGALRHAEVSEKLPLVAHQIRKSYKDAGLTVTSAAIYTNIRKVSTDHSAVSLGKIEYEVFDYWNFIEYVDEIKTLKLLDFNRQEIIDLYHQGKNKFLLLGSSEISANAGLLDLIDDEYIESLNLDELQKLKELIYSFPRELETLLNRDNIRNILSWDDKKIRILSSSDIDDIIDSEQSFGDIEECYDKDSDITEDLIKNGGNLDGSFSYNFERYQNKKEIYEKTQREDPGSLIQEFDPLGEMESEDIKDGCPDGWFANSEESYNESEQAYSLEASDVPDIIEYFSKHAYRGWQEDFEKELEDSESSFDYNCDFYSGKQREEKSSDRGEILLHNAAYEDDATSMELLLQQGADSNVVNNEGISPLHIALAHLNLPMVQLLLEYGGDLSLSPFNDGSERTVADLLEIAGEEKSDELEEFVLELIELLNFGCSDGFVWAEHSDQYKNNYDLQQAQLDQVDDLMTLVEHRAELWKNLGADLPGFAYTDEESELKYTVENRDIERIDNLKDYILNDPDRIAGVLEILEEASVKSEYVNSWLETAYPAQHQNILRCAIENDDKEVLDLLKEYDVEICYSENDETNGLCASKNSNDLDVEYKGVENSGCTAIGMNKRSIHVSMQVISAHQSGYIKSIHGLLYNVCPSKRYLIIDSERERSDSILKSDLINAHPNIAVVFTGVQYDAHINTASCADNVLLSLSLMREYKTYVLQINTLNYNHLITVVEYELWQEDEVMHKLMQVKSGRYEIEDSGDKIWNNYKEKFIDKTVKICETIDAPCETTGSLSGGALMPIIEIPVAHEERFITIMNEINQSFRLTNSDSSSKMIMEETYDSIQSQGGVVVNDVISIAHSNNGVGKLLHALNEYIIKLGQEQDDSVIAKIIQEDEYHRVETGDIIQQISDRSSALVQPNYESSQESDSQFILIGEQAKVDIAINNKQKHSAVALIAGGAEEGIVPVTTLVITDTYNNGRSEDMRMRSEFGFDTYNNGEREGQYNLDANNNQRLSFRNIIGKIESITHEIKTIAEQLPIKVGRAIIDLLPESLRDKLADRYVVEERHSFIISKSELDEVKQLLAEGVIDQSHKVIIKDKYGIEIDKITGFVESKISLEKAKVEFLEKIEELRKTESISKRIEDIFKKDPSKWSDKEGRQIALEYHPDKQHGKSGASKDRAEEIMKSYNSFKEVKGNANNNVVIEVSYKRHLWDSILDKVIEPITRSVPKYTKEADIGIDLAKMYLKPNIENGLNTIYDGIALYNKVSPNALSASVVMVTTPITSLYNFYKGDYEKAGIQGINGLSYYMLNSKYLPGYGLHAYAGLNVITIVYDFYKGEFLEAGLQIVGIAGMVFAPTLTGACYAIRYTYNNAYGLYQLYQAKQQENILGFNKIITRLLVKTINDNIYDEVIQNILRSISLDQRLEEAGVKEEVAIIRNEYNERDDTDLISLEDISEYLKDKNKVVVIRQINNLDATKLIKERVDKLINEGGGVLNYLKEYVGYVNDAISETKRVESIKLEIIQLLDKKDVSYDEVETMVNNAIDIMKSQYLPSLYNSMVNNEVLKILKELGEEVLIARNKDKVREEESKEYHTEEVRRMIVEKEGEEVTITEISPYKQLTGQTSEEQSYCNRMSKENEKNKIYESIKCTRKDLDIADITNNKLHLPMMMGLDETVADILIDSENNYSKDNNKNVLYYWNREHKSKLEEVLINLSNNEELINIITKEIEESKSWIIPQSIKQEIITEEYIKEKAEKELSIIENTIDYGKSFFVSDNRSLDDRLDEYLVNKVTDKSKESDVATMIRIMSVNKEGCYMHGYILDSYAEIIDHQTVESNDSELCNNEISNYINKGDMDAQN